MMRGMLGLAHSALKTRVNALMSPRMRDLCAGSKTWMAATGAAMTGLRFRPIGKCFQLRLSDSISSECVITRLELTTQCAQNCPHIGRPGEIHQETRLSRPQVRRHHQYVRNSSSPSECEQAAASPHRRRILDHRIRPHAGPVRRGRAGGSILRSRCSRAGTASAGAVPFPTKSVALGHCG
jgi:hypothetical protein